MDTRCRHARTGVGADALATAGHSRVVHWVMVAVISISMIAGVPRPAMALDVTQREDAATAMVLLLMLGQALQKSKLPGEPADRAGKPAAQPASQPATAAVPEDAPVVDATTVAAPTPLLPAKPIPAPAPAAR